MQRENKAANRIKPDISIFGPSYRPENWMSLYRSIGDNDVSFEIIFVGPNEPDFELPSNLKFIKSCVKPMQCFEIAARNATGDLIMDIADDIEFKTKNPLDRLYNIYKSHNNEKLILSCRYILDGEDLSDDCRYFFTGDKSSPVLPFCGLMSRKLYGEIGGIDRNFEAIFWEVDIAMRVYALGGTVVMSDVYVNEDKSKCAEPERDLWGETGVHDRALLESLWITDGKVHFNRKNPVEPFSDINILNASQGPRGRWRGNGFLLFEKIEDNILSQRSIPRRVIRGIRKPSMYFDYARRMALRLKEAL